MIKLLRLFDCDLPEDFKIIKALEILGFRENISINTQRYILNEIVGYIFDIKQKNTSKKVFDYEYDYKYYFYDFLKLGINLNKTDISWWEFDAILEGLFLEEKSCIGQVVQYRLYEKPSNSSRANEAKEDKFYRDKKRQYALPNKEQTLDKMWSYLENEVDKK